MALSIINAGQYTCSIQWAIDAVNNFTGLTRNGYQIGFTPAYVDIDDTDAYGKQLIEQVPLGFSRVTVDFVCKDWRLGVVRSANPFKLYNAGAPNTKFGFGKVGKRGSRDVSGIMVLTAVAGTPAASLGPATLTAGYIMPAPGFATSWLHGPKHRETPFKFNMLLYDDTGSNTDGVYWVAT